MPLIHGWNRWQILCIYLTNELIVVGREQSVQRLTHNSNHILSCLHGLLQWTDALRMPQGLNADLWDKPLILLSLPVYIILRMRGHQKKFHKTVGLPSLSTCCTVINGMYTPVAYLKMVNLHCLATTSHRTQKDVTKFTLYSCHFV